ncbi:MAG: (Fe-S)-binding protein [Chloroflexi bacterium]|nr:(Fe-S)-binding protein [Chloroflexota bacterium]
MVDLTRVIKETGIRLCLDCGKCTVVCPVARYDHEFNPRLIVQGALRRNGSGPVDAAVWSCLSCNMCMERCNYNVKYTDFIRSLRYKAVAEGAELQYNHGGIMQTAMHIAGHRNIKAKNFDWLPEDIEVDKQSNTAFFVGCAPYFDVVFSDLNTNTVEGTRGALRLLNRAQIPFRLLDGERCCGRDLLLIGDLKGFLTLANANAHEFSSKGVKRIVTSCPECYYTLKVDYPKFVEKWNMQVVHATEVLAPLVADGRLAMGRLTETVTYHDPCTLGRYSRIFDQPRALLTSIEGLKLVEMVDNREKALCCGASPWAYCDSVHKQIQTERLDQAKDTGAEVMVTACPKCQIHLKCAQKDAGDVGTKKVKIKDIFSLIAESFLT